MRVRAVLCCAILAVAVAGIAMARARDDDGAAAALAASTLRLGINANSIGWGDAVGGEQALAAATGARWLREELQWAAVVPRKGERHWARADRMFASAAKRGLKVLPVLNEAPRWAAGRDHALPADARGYGAFVADAVARYGPQGSFWRAHPALDADLAPTYFELWNEPYFARPAHGAVTAGRYAALAAVAIRSGATANPGARFLVAVDPATATEPELDARWLDRLAAAQPSLLAGAAGVATHPYAADGAASLRSLDRLRAVLAARTLPLPVWVTEIGWTTCSGAADCVTERAQAADLRTFLNGVRRGDRADAIFYYHLRSWRVRSGDQFYGDFGLLRANRSRKPAWTVFRLFANGLHRAGAP
ncbi:MAG TPA: hypothetical protein VNT55_21145 [Baekduia sp.]|nr:hypothetical protein [Baekduia sp.]